jgi:hypothetical protein
MEGDNEFVLTPPQLAQPAQDMETSNRDLTPEEKGALAADSSAYQKLKQDPQSAHLLQMVTGPAPIMEKATLDALETVWSKLDYNNDRVLSREDFASALGSDPVWINLLYMCDMDADGEVTDKEFIQGFLLFALNKEFPVMLKGTMTCMGFLKQVQTWSNALIIERIGELTAYMKSRNVPNW